MIRARALVSVLLVLACLAPLGAETRPTALDLLTAARRGDVATIRSALDAGVDVNATDPNFRQTALIRATMFGQVDAARVLVDAGADVERVASPDDMRVLHFAAMAGSGEIVRLLVGAGVLVDARDALSKTPLDHALSVGAVPVVEALLAGGADPNHLGSSVARRIGMALNPDVPANEVEALLAVIRTGRGLERDGEVTGERTALLALAGRANRAGAERFAEALVAAGADLAATDENGRTARTIVEEWLTRQRDAGYRGTMEAVVGILRDAEARR